MKTCENCGCAVYKLGCVNCDELVYIEQQDSLTTGVLLAALKSIAANTCCDQCHEAALVASAALSQGEQPK